MTHASAPHETFLSDQALAYAREQAADGRTVALVLDHATDGQCSWCDCSLDSAAHTAGGRGCSGCPKDADYMASIFNGSNVRQDIPICEGHLPDFTAAVYALTGASG